MGTETKSSGTAGCGLPSKHIKLNNPLMGTETKFRCLFYRR